MRDAPDAGTRTAVGPSTRPLTVLLIGHSCRPNYGSEPGITWNWAWHLSARHRIWVLAHPEYRQEVDRFLVEHPNPNLRFVWVTLPRHLDPWDPAGPGWGIGLHYLLWQRTAFSEAVRLYGRHPFDLAHYVSPSTVSAPPPPWRLPVPLIWGPLGGGQVTPAAFRHYLGMARVEDRLRTLRVKLLHYLPALHRAIRQSALVLAANRETVGVLETAGARGVRLFPDVGIPPDYLPPAPHERPVRPDLTLLWAGRLHPRKGFALALEALARTADVPARLVVAGDGALRVQFERVASALGLASRVTFLGGVAWQRLPEVFRRADAFLFTSLRDTMGTVLFEAMAHALPIVTLDHQGAGLHVPGVAGIKVPVTTPAETVDRLAGAIRDLARNPEARERMGRAAWEAVRMHTWDRRADTMLGWYEDVVGRARDAACAEVGRAAGAGRQRFERLL